MARFAPSIILFGLFLYDPAAMGQEPGAEGESEVPAEAVLMQSSHGHVLKQPSGPVPFNYYSPAWRPWGEPAPAPSPEVMSTSHLYMENCLDCPDDHPWFFEGGLVALQRERWEGGSYLTRGGDTLLSKDDLHSRLEWGGKFSAGTRCWDCREFEMTGFWVTDMQRASSGRGPFNVNLPVSNPPFGFDDFANNASLIALEYETDLGGFEVLWRNWGVLESGDPCCGTNCSGHVGCPISVGIEFGVRYLNVDEQLSIYSQFGPAPGLGGLQDYNYLTSADNHIVGPQIGIQIRTAPWLCFDLLLSSRFALAANFIDTEVSLRERTGNVAFDESRDEVSFAQVWDTSIYLRLRPSRHLDVRVGYQLLWINGYAGAVDQYGRNLSRPGQFDDDNGILFQGPSMSVQVNF